MLLCCPSIFYFWYTSPFCWAHNRYFHSLLIASLIHQPSLRHYSCILLHHPLLGIQIVRASDTRSGTALEKFVVFCFDPHRLSLFRFSIHHYFYVVHLYFILLLPITILFSTHHYSEYFSSVTCSHHYFALLHIVRLWYELFCWITINSVAIRILSISWCSWSLLDTPNLLYARSCIY